MDLSSLTPDKQVKLQYWLDVKVSGVQIPNTAYGALP